MDELILAGEANRRFSEVRNVRAKGVAPSALFARFRRERARWPARMDGSGGSFAGAFGRGDLEQAFDILP